MHDLRYALRALRRNPGFTAVAVLSLALGIGANTAIFSIYSAFFLRKLPVHQPDRLVHIYTGDEDLEWATSCYPDFLDYREGTRALFDGMFVYNMSLGTLQGEIESEMLFGEMVGGDYFQVLGLRPEIGRVLIPSDDTEGAPPVVVLGWQAWQSRFGGDPGIIGRTIPLGSSSFTVVGVAPRVFRGLYPLTDEYWIPIHQETDLMGSGERLDSRGGRSLFIMGRLKEGVSVEQADTAIRSVAERLAEAYPETNEKRSAKVFSTRDVAILPLVDGPIKMVTIFMLFMVGLVLLIACTNLANLLLARASARKKEIGVRLALGSGRWRLVRQLMTESTLLAGGGGLAGLLLALWIIRLIETFQPPIPIPITLELGLDGPTLFFALGISVLTGLVFGLLPAVQATRPDLVESIKGTGRTMTGRLRRFGLRSSLVVGQVAVSSILLVSAGLFLRSLGNAGRIDPGFDVRDGVVAMYMLPEDRFDEVKAIDFNSRLKQRLLTLPGVEAVSLTDRLPLGAGISTTDVYPISSEVPVGPDGAEIDYGNVDEDYFRAMGTAIVAGRAFLPGDDRTSQQVVIVNRTLAERFWPGESAVGHQIRLHGEDGAPRLIVGVAENGKYRTLGEDPRSYVWIPSLQDNLFFNTLLVRSRVDGAGLLRPVRETIRELDPGIAVMSLVTVPQHFELMTFIPRAIAAMLTAFGLLSLLLGTTGLYGVIAFDVARRTREVGIRIALGALRGEVLRLILWDGMKLVVVGVAVGLGLATLITGFFSAYLFDVGATDPVAFIGVALLMLGVTVAATLRPARRAAATNPVEALRHE
jgi:predicted permease